tara:strand:+ start:2743 stop:3297 length:555 start_codon:yes stop_codon:yes gene_type:complete
MKINKESSIYFVGFFTLVIFGFVLALNFVNINLKDKIKNAKTAEINNILVNNMQCKNYNKEVLEGKELFYCKNSNLVALRSFSPGYVDKIEYIAVIDITTNQVKHISIVNHQETPGLGDKIADTAWLETIYNKTFAKLKIKQQNGDIDSFTAATITPTSFLANLRVNIKWLNKNKEYIKTITQG